MIRPATAADRPWLVGLGARAFAALGDYATILPAWLDQPHVMAWVAGAAEGRRGFVVLGCFAGDHPGEVVTDLLALAVEPAHRARGLGRALLGHAIAEAEALRPRVAPARLVELRLAVADDNFIGQRLYRSAGFAVAPGDLGAYPGGQRALRMVLALAAAAPRQDAVARDGVGAVAAAVR